jgi:tetratricopeptide (TPR) repeat protein
MSEIKKLRLNEALSYIQQACEAREKPFFFIVGAGISYPPVKLAWQMIEDFKKEARKRHRYKEPSGTEAIDKYSEWFIQAYQSPVERQDYIRKQIEGKYISDANFRLAHILLEQKVASLVITPNFDDFLSRALHLFGKQPLDYGQPEMFKYIDAEREDIQIVHVHGSYKFYEISNLKAEILEQAEGTTTQPSKTASIIENLLSRRSPLVVGYSGWEGDVIMTGLKRAIDGRHLRNNIYWFCYKESNIDSLPVWLKHHPNVFFVVPSLGSQGAYDLEYTSSTRIANETTLAKDIEPTKLFRQKRGELSLSAQEVFNHFIRAFELKIPALTHDPIKFFIDQLSKSLPRQSKKNLDDDIYSIKSVIDRLQRAKQIEEEEISQSIIAKLEAVRNALRSSNYEGIIQIVKDIDLKQLSNENRNEVVESLWTTVEEIHGDSNLEQEAYDLIIQIGSYLSPPINYTTRLALARSYIGKGLILGEQELYQNAVAAFDKAINRIGKADKKQLYGALAMALINKAVMLGAQGDHKDALTLYKQVVQKFGKSRDITLQRGLIRTLYNMALCLYRLNKNKEIMPIYEEIKKRFRNIDDLDIADVFASALINQGYFWGVFGELDKEIKSYDEVVTRYGSSEKRILQRAVSIALLNKAIAHLKAKEWDKALDVSKNVIKRYKDENSFSLQQSVSKAILVQGEALDESGYKDRAIASYKKVVRRYISINDPLLQYAAAFALVKKGNAYENVAQAINAYDEVINSFGQSYDPKLQEQVAIAMYNKGNKWAEANDQKEAIRTYKELEKRFGRKKDSPIQSILSRSLVNKGTALAALNRHRKAIQVYNDIIEKFSNTDNINIKSDVVAALFNKGVALIKLGEKAKANKIFDDLIDQYANVKEESISVQVANGMIQKGLNLSAIDKNADALKIIDKVILKFKKSKQTPNKIAFARAIETKGYILSNLNRHDDSIKAYNKVLKLFSGITDPKFAEVIAVAKNGIAFQLICKAKKDLLNRKSRMAITKLKKAQEIATEALKHNFIPLRSLGFIWGNLGYIAFLLGNTSGAREAFKKSFKLGGNELFKEAVKDTTRYTLEEDKKFIKLIRSVKLSM